MAESDMLWRRLLPGLLAGLAGGSVYGLFGGQDQLPLVGSAVVSLHPWLWLAEHVLIGAVIGVGFGAFLGRLVNTAGSGLLWGEAHALLWWIVGPLTLFPLLSESQPAWTVDAARSAFPALVGYMVGYGAVLGLAYSGFSAVLVDGLGRAVLRRVTPDFLLAAVVGGLAGLVGGLAFGVWMERVGFFPLVAALVGLDSPDVGRALHFMISVIIGASYGVLFRLDILSPGSSIAWGLGYGAIWWVLGPLTIMPVWLGQGVQWSLVAAQAAFPSLVGHLIYGILLGLVYSMVDKFWHIFFVEADPLMREPEGPGTRSLRALGMGVLASIAGGLAFTIVMVETGALPVVASLIGLKSAAEGFLVHMTISAVIGATYGLLFRLEAYTYGAGLAWGLVYGLIWWFLGPLTLMPIFLGAELHWSLTLALGAYPSLIGHLAYGALTALVYQLLLRRYDPSLRGRGRTGRERLQRTSGTPAPALWALVLTLGLMLPILFSR